jgi:hypothetical protein
MWGFVAERMLVLVEKGTHTSHRGISEPGLDHHGETIAAAGHPHGSHYNLAYTGNPPHFMTWSLSIRDKCVSSGPRAQGRHRLDLAGAPAPGPLAAQVSAVQRDARVSSATPRTSFFDLHVSSLYNSLILEFHGPITKENPARQFPI